MGKVDQRRTRRVAVHSEGVAVMDGHHLNFRTRDLSLGGSGIELQDTQAPRIGASVRVFLDNPALTADASVRWQQPAGAGLVRIGLQFRELDFSYQNRADFLAAVG